MLFSGFDAVTWEMKWRFLKTKYPFCDSNGRLIPYSNLFAETAVPLAIAVNAPTWEAYAASLESLARRGVRSEEWGELAEDARRGMLQLRIHSRAHRSRTVSLREHAPTPLDAVAREFRREERVGLEARISWAVWIYPVWDGAYSATARIDDRRRLQFSAIDQDAVERRGAMDAISDAFYRRLEDGSQAGNIRWKKAMVRKILAMLFDEDRTESRRQIDSLAPGCDSTPETFESLRAQGKTLGEINQIFAERGQPEVTEGEGLLHRPTSSHQICWDSPRKWTDAQVADAKASLAESGLIGRFITEGERNEQAARH